jgi:hypothetical protein
MTESHRDPQRAQIAGHRQSEQDPGERSEQMQTARAYAELIEEAHDLCARGRPREALKKVRQAERLVQCAADGSTPVEQTGMNTWTVSLYDKSLPTTIATRISNFLFGSKPTLPGR